MKAKLLWIWLVIVSALAAVVAWFKSKDAADRAARDESVRKGEELKAKIAEVKAEQAARKEATDAAVAQVDEAAKVDAARDPVALANDLILDAKGASDPVIKG
jgi:C4-dicarboxylate-specific signal transduction histidine kinase